MNQTRIIATAPVLGDRKGRGVLARSTVVVSTSKFLEASEIEILGLMDLIERALRKRGGDLSQITYQMEPVGPQLQLVTVDGKRI